MTRRRAICFAVAVFAAAIAFYGRVPADDQSSPKTAVRLIPAKVLEVHAEGCPFAAISEPEVKMIDSRAFIVGKYVGDKDGPGPFAGCKMWFPLDKVTHLIEFDSIEAARKPH